jgi:hypothetical protein
MKDRKEAGRAKLFTKWFEAGGAPGWDLINYELQDPNEEGLIYFAGLIVHSDHPNYSSIPDAFANFLEDDVSSGKFVRRS